MKKTRDEIISLLEQRTVLGAVLYALTVTNHKVTPTHYSNITLNLLVDLVDNLKECTEFTKYELVYRDVHVRRLDKTTYNCIIGSGLSGLTILTKP